MVQPKYNTLRTVFQTASITFLAAIGLTVLGTGLFVFNLLRGLPDVKSLKSFQHSHTTEVFSADGKKIGEFTTERRYPVRFETIPKHVLYAFVAAEDSKFFEHHGIDYTGIARAAISNILRGRYAQGGSTITQQVARGILLETRKKEITRKIREMILARRMEQQLTKNEILSLYLSEIYLGHGSYGIGAAAKNYFNKEVHQLTLAEGAVLAGLPQRPNDWDPFHSPAMAKRRQGYVLKRMLEEKFIEEKDYQLAGSQPLRLYQLTELNNSIAPYFTEYVRQYLMGKYGSEKILSQGYKVYTTVNHSMQKAAEQALDRGVREVDKRLGWRGPLQHLDTPEKVSAFVAKVHEQEIEKLDPVRILPVTVDASMKKLDYELEPFLGKNGNYIGPTPVREKAFYEAVVTQVVEPPKAGVIAQIGQTKIVLPKEGFEWVKINEQPLKSPSQILKVGDVIQVKVEKIDKKANLVTALLEQPPEIQGGFLSYEVSNGDVRAMVGGIDFQKSKFNTALQAKRQVGSTFKPLIYAAAIDKGFSPSSLVTDAPLVFSYEGALDADSQGEAWRPHNFSGKFEGDLPLRLALIRSMNIPTVKVLNEITVDYGIQYARTLGITAVLPRDLTIALGSWSSSLEELMRAYSIFPRLGKQVQLRYISKILDGEGNVLEDNTLQSDKNPPLTRSVVMGDAPTQTAESETPEHVISPQTAYVMTDMLKGVVREGTGRGAYLSTVPIAGKTGTSNDHRDAWFIGYSPHLMTGVWLGYEKDKPLDAGETGGRAAAPIFAEFMAVASKDYPKGDFPIPDDIVFAYVEKDTGRLASSRSQNRVKVAFKVGTVPNERGDNVARIGEPGSTASDRANAATAPSTSLPDEDGSAPAEETSDYMREGYQ